MEDERIAAPAAATEDASVAPEPAPAPDPLTALRDEWGERYDDNLGAARRLVSEVASPELVAAFDRAGLGEDPNLIRAVAAVARRVYDAPAPAGGEADRIAKRLDALHALQYADDPAKRAEYRSQAVQGELSRLYAALYGDAPGSTGLARNI
jgi:hypothetical protein